MPDPTQTDGSWRSWVPGSAAVAAAADWLQRHTPKPSAEVRAHFEQRERDRVAAEQAMRARTTEWWRGAADAIPAPIREAGGALVDQVRGAAGALFEPDAGVKAAVDAQRPQTTDANAPVLDWASAPARLMRNLALDQVTDMTSPGGAALNLIDAIPGGGVAAAGVAPITLGGRRPLGSLAAGVKALRGEARYQLRPSVLDRFAEVYPLGRELGQGGLPTWESAQGERMMRAFDDNTQRAYQWARLLGASSAGTDVPINTRESVAALAHVLHNPGQPFRTSPVGSNKFKHSPKTGLWTPEQGLSLYDTVITNAPSKVPNFNRILRGEPMSGDKVEAFGQFNWGDPRTPIDRHVLWAAGADTDKLSDHLPALREMMQQHEGVKISDADAYYRYEDALREGLQSLDPRRAYRPLFGDAWEGIRVAKGLPPQGGPAGLLEAEGLGERGALLDPDRIADVLRRTQGRSFRLPR